MLRIAICDDSPEYLARLYTLTEAFFLGKDVPHNICTFDDGAKLVENSDVDFDIIVLDVKMKTMDGIQTAKILRQKNQSSMIIYVSEYLEFAIRGYEVEAFRYLLKKDIDEQFIECLGSAYNQWQRSQQLYPFSFSGVYSNVYLESIVYFESRKREIFLFLRNGSQQVHYGKLRDVERKIECSDFARIHQSYIVNMKHIEKVEYTKVHMKGGIILPISDSRRAAFNRSYMLYKSEMR